MKLFKIDPLGTVKEIDTEGPPEQVLEEMKKLLDGWPEIVSLPIFFENEKVQLIAMVSDMGAIDGKTVPNTLATQFYRNNGQLANMNGRPAFLWGDAYFGTFDYNDEDAYPSSLPASYDVAKFLELLPRLIRCQERFLLV